MVNVAVAWGRVLAKGSVSYSTRYFHNAAWGSRVIAIHQSRGYNVAWPVDRPGSLLAESPHWVRDFEGEPWWHASTWELNSNNYSVACGWPLFALTAWRTVLDDNEMSFPGAINYGIALTPPSAQGSVEWVPPILALMPIWPGFAINTVCYAVVLWLLSAGPFVVRRRRRIRRGLCPRCAYDLRGSAGATTCPECGAAVSPRRLQRQPQRVSAAVDPDAVEWPIAEFVRHSIGDP